ncbi:MAG: tetratricopeptide repeat protein [Blastocatellales bacterium]
MSAFLEFHLQSDTSEIFNVTVFERNSSQPLAAARFEYRLDDLAQFEISRLDFNPRDPLGRLERLQAFGRKLYQKLFTAEIEQIWRKHRDRGDFLTLCVRIHDDAKRLEAVPWEALHDGAEFVAAGAKTTITRLPLGIAPPADLPAIPLPIRMLALVSSPPDLPDGSRLNIEREQELLLEAINAPAGQGKLHVDFEDEAKLEILESSLEAGYHILHFTGHGIAPENGGGLLLEDHDGKRLPVGVNDFVSSLAKGIGTLRLAVIAGCNTAQALYTSGFRDLARALVEKKVPAVLAMQFAISDTAGLKLAEVLYPKLIAGQSLEAAVHAARRALWLTDEPVLQADALAMVLLTGNGNCLQAKAADAPTVNFNPVIDTSFQLGTLPQLGFKFYGRRKEYRQLRDALLVNNHRAVIIHGIGGIGKTSLIAHTADRLYHRRRQGEARFKGVYAFDCAGSTLAPERVLLELHRYFALQGVNALERFIGQLLEPEVLAQIVAQALTQWPLLLIFDNFETQLARTEAGFGIADEGLRRFLSALVKATATNTKFVFTCRFLFELDERLGDVASLPLGDLSRPEAISLMLRLPNLAKSNFWDQAKAYEYFGGHPFAIMQLDKHCQGYSLYEALQNAEALHTKLRDHLALELNYGRLTEQARELLNRLAAFRVAVPMEAAELMMKNADDTVPRVVACGLGDNATKSLSFPAPQQDAIRELIGWSLLTPMYEGNELSHLDVHSLVRDFCREKQGGVWRDRLRKAASYYINLTRSTHDKQKTPAMVWSDMEAFELLMEAEAYDYAAQLLLGAHELLRRWGFRQYIDRQYLRVVDQVDRAKAATLMHNFGVVHQDRKNYDEALDYYQQSLKIKEEIGDMAGLAGSLHQIGWVHQDRGNYDVALNYYHRSLKINEEIGDVRGVATSLHHIGWVWQYRGNYDEALDYYQRALKIKEEIGELAVIASSLLNIGVIHHTRRNYDKALDYYQRSLKISEEIGDLGSVADSLHNIGATHRNQGNYNEAMEYYQRSLKIREEIGNVTGISNSLHQIGVVHQDCGNYDEALGYYQRSLKTMEKIGDVGGAASSQGQIGRLLMETEHYAEAFELLRETLNVFIKLQSPNAGIAVINLKTLRSKWDGFDAAWREATGEDVPDWLQ